MPLCKILLEGDTSQLAGTQREERGKPSFLESIFKGGLKTFPGGERAVSTWEDLREEEVGGVATPIKITQGGIALHL